VPPIQYGPDFQRSQQGQHVWDFNYTGVAHYGMLPDFLVAARAAPDGPDLVDNNLMYGAQYFYETWQRAEAQSGNAAGVANAAITLSAAGMCPGN
jgi:hypothetical protein